MYINNKYYLTIVLYVIIYLLFSINLISFQSKYEASLLNITVLFIYCCLFFIYKYLNFYIINDLNEYSPYKRSKTSASISLL